MGIAFVLIIYLLVLGGLAVLSSLALGLGLRFYLRAVERPKRWIIAFATVLPFASVLYAGIWFMGYTLISDAVFHHDPMIGDGWYTDIGNGYAIDMIDVTDQGIVHPVTGNDRGLNDSSGIDGVRRLQVASPYLFGTKDKRAFEHLGQESGEEDLFFAVDTRDRSKVAFASESQLYTYANSKGKALALKPILEVYEQHRSRLFDLAAVATLLIVPAMGLLSTLRKAYTLRHTQRQDA